MTNDLILKRIVGFPNYKAGSDGNIYSDHLLKDGTHKLKALKPGWTSFGGYANVDLSKNGKLVTKRVHVLICTAFHGPRPYKMDAGHMDDDRKNNTPENLKWMTRAENAEIKVALSVARTGKRPNACFTESQVAEIRILIAAGETNGDIATKYNVNSSVIKKLRIGRTYAKPLRKL